MTQHPPPQPALKFIFLTLLLDVIGFGLLIPVGPRLVEELMHGTEADAAPVVGILAATYAAMQFIFAPTLGALSDRFGRRPVILFALLGSGLDYFAMALAPALWLLFATRIINGITGANITACNAYVADVTPPEKRAAGFGMVGAAFGLGFVIGPLMGGLLGEIDNRLPFWVAGGLTLLNAAYGYFVLPESLPPERRRPVALARLSPMSVFAHVGRNRLVFGLACALFLLNFAQFMLHATWVLYTSHRYHWTALDAGLSLFAVGLGAAVVQGFLAKRVVAHFGERRALIGGIAIGALAYLGYALATDGWMIYVIILLASLGGVAQPAAQAIITKSTPPTEQGEVQGALAGLAGIASVLGNPAGGIILGYFISQNAPVHLPGASYFLSSIVAVLGLVVTIAVLRRSPRLSEPRE